MRKHRLLAAAFALAIAGSGLVASDDAVAQEWNPFDPFSNSSSSKQRQAQPDGPPTGAASDDVIRPLGNGGGTAVERGDLAPVMAPDGSGLPYELWQGLDVGRLERLISEIADLWFHTYVLLAARGLDPASVEDELARRASA